MVRLVYTFLFWIIGWKVTGWRPDLDKYIMIVGPHTSGWDFLLGVATRGILKLDIKFLGKKELFKFPFGAYFRWLGGHPVDRSKSTSLVDFVVETFDKSEKFLLAIAPEGTRSYVPKWKTGFYYMALKAKVPIVMVGFDYGRKELNLQPPFYPTGSLEKDLEIMQAYYRGIKGKHPEKATGFKAI